MFSQVSDNRRDYQVVFGKTRKNWRRILWHAFTQWPIGIILCVVYWFPLREPVLLIGAVLLLGGLVAELFSPRVRIFASGIWCPVPHPEDVYELQRERVKADLEAKNPGITVLPRAVAVIIGNEDEAVAYVPASEVDAQGNEQQVWLFAVYASGGDRSGKYPRPLWLPIQAIFRGPLTQAFETTRGARELQRGHDSSEKVFREHLSEIQRQIEAQLVCNRMVLIIDWLLIERFELHEFEDGVFVLLPLRIRSVTREGTHVDHDAYAAAYSTYLLPQDWHPLPLVLGLMPGLSPEDEARRYLATILGGASEEEL